MPFSTKVQNLNFEFYTRKYITTTQTPYKHPYTHRLNNPYIKHIHLR